MNIRSFLPPSFFALLLVGCSSGTTTGAGADAATAAPDTGPAVADGGTDAEVVADAAATKPVTPQIASVAKMTGSLHVTWKLNDTGLSGVELWRNKDTGAYAKLLGLPGSATNYHDTSADAAGSNYCYQVMTMKGDVASDKSNEVCGTP